MINTILTLNLNLIDAIYSDLSKYLDSDNTQIHTRYGGTKVIFFKIIQKNTLARWEIGRYQIEDAAEFISKYGDVKFELILKKLQDAVKNGDLDTYPIGQNIIRDIGKSEISDEAYWEDLNEWLDKNEKRITWRFTKPTPQNENSPDIIKKIKGEPKKVIQRVFENLHFNYYQWGRNLADPPHWLLPCRVLKGSKGRKISHSWDPILIGLALMDKGITKKQLNLAFMDLKDWKEEWQEKRDLMD